MAKIDWDYARNADRWTLEEFSEFVCPDDPSAQAKLDRLARVAIDARTLSSEPFRHPRFHPGIYGETPQRKNDIIKLIPAEALSFAQRKGFTPPPQLAGIASPRPADETQPSTSIAPDNEPRRNKAPHIFIAALIWRFQRETVFIRTGPRARHLTMAYEKAAWGVEFRRRMAEYDSSRGIEPAAAPLRPAAEPSPATISASSRPPVASGSRAHRFA